MVHRLLLRVRRKFGPVFFQWPRIIKYRLLSDMHIVNGCPIIHQPVLFRGRGSIIFGKAVNFGVVPSPHFYSGYSYVEARKANSAIEIADHVWLNNNCVLISEGPGISIGSRTLLGTCVEIYDSDFHSLDFKERMNGGIARKGFVKIGANVFIGSNVKVLKGVTIGDNSVIGNHSLVSGDIPPNTIAAGNPAQVIRKLQD